MSLLLILFLFFTALEAALVPPCPAYALEMVIAYENKAQPPYYMGNTDVPLTTKPGVAVEMVQMLEKRIPNLKIRLIRAPWKRCLKLLEFDKVDGIFNSSFTWNRTVIGRYPMKNGQVDQERRLATITYSFYRMPESPIRWDGRTLSGLQGVVGAPLGYSIVADLKAMRVKVDEAPATKLALGKLLRGRNAAAALQTVTADTLICSIPEFKNIVKIYPPLKTKAYYLMLSRKFADHHPGLAEQIWNELAIIREEELHCLLSSYPD